MQQDSTPPPRAVHAGWFVAASVALVGVTGLIDYATGVELRVYPLYFLPLALTAWRAGRIATVSIAVACAAMWLLSNQAAGMRFSQTRYLVGSMAAHLVSFVFIGLLVSILRRQAEGERMAARRDALTSLLNAQGFYEALYREVRRSQRYGSWLTLAYLDLDNFKQVNDTAGHRAGDDVLRLVARLLRDETRATDVVARLGGDEFVVVLPETDAAGAGTLLERLRLHLERSMRERGWDVSASIGAVSVTGPGQDLDALVAQADAQMYQVKRLGKNRVGVHELGAQEASEGPKPTVSRAVNAG